MRELDRFALGVLTTFFATSSMLGQLELRVDTAKIQWGEPIQLTAEWLLQANELSAGLGAPSQWPNWADSIPNGFEVLDASPLDTIPAPLDASGDVMLRKTWTITSWDSGFVVLAPGQFSSLRSNPILIEVRTPILEDDAQVRPPTNLIEVHWSWWEWVVLHWKWMLGIVALALGLFGLKHALALLRTRPENKTEVEPLSGPTESPETIALRVLRRILKEEVWNQGRGKEAQAEASLIIRQYLEQRFDVPAAERTTTEIRGLLPFSAIPTAWHARLLAAFEHADSVKFAKGQMPAERHRNLLETYVAFVLDNQPQEPKQDA